MNQAPGTPAAPTPQTPAEKHGLRWLLLLWFGLSKKVTPRAYRNTGFLLMLVKYLADAGLIFVAAGGRVWQPWEYLTPWMNLHAKLPSGVGMALVVQTLPFMWVGVSMTARRAVNAGFSGGTGVGLFFVPLINYLWMVALCALPEQSTDTWGRSGHSQLEPAWRAALLGVASSVLVGLGMMAFSVLLLQGYGAGLFVGSPFLMGVASGWFFNRHQRRTVAATVQVATLAVALTGGAILMFALEGVICVAMAAPVAWGMVALGALLGRVMAGTTAHHGVALVLMAVSLPVLTGMEHAAGAPSLHRVVTEVIIDAPPTRVWPFVVGHSALPPPQRWFFKLGIAYPVQSTTFGQGVGATRHCSFSTGPLVETVTVWEPGERLAFVAESQPAPMKELSPYDIEPPHLDGYVRPRTGEFRLEPLADNRTRLVGTTEYQSALAPDVYWSVWSDALVHAVHQRVFEHIKRLSEAP